MNLVRMEPYKTRHEAWDVLSDRKQLEKWHTVKWNKVADIYVTQILFQIFFWFFFWKMDVQTKNAGTQKKTIVNP